MDFTRWIDKLTKEGAVISDAPLVFGISLVLAGLAIWWVVNRCYSERNHIKDDLITSLREKLSLISEKAIIDLPTQQRLQRSTAKQQSLPAHSILEIGLANVASGEEIIFEGQDGANQACYLEIHNVTPNVDAEDVEVKVESYDRIDDLLIPKVETKLLIRSNVSLMFKKGGHTRTIRRSEREHLRFVTYRKSPPRQWIQIGEYTDDMFDRRDKIVAGAGTPHRLNLSIRAKNAQPISKSFVVSAKNGLLTVSTLL